MPEIRSFKVTQVREVMVSAITLTDAAVIATAAFENGQNGDRGVSPPLPDVVYGNTTTEIRVVDLRIEGPR